MGEDSPPAVLLDVSDHIATITLNRPEKRNPMSPALIDGFKARVDEIAARKDVRAVVVTGAGKSFCAGADFMTMPTLAERTGLDGVLGMHGAIEQLYDAFVSLDRLEVPTIAAVNGAAIGGGMGIALLCDLRVIAEDAKLGVNFARLGIHSGLSITSLLPKLVGYEAAADLLFTGRIFLGTEAGEMGLARRVVPKDEVVPVAMDLARQITLAAPLAVRWIKRTLRHNTDRWLSPGMVTEAMAQILLMQSKDSQEGIQAMLQRRDPEFEGR